MEIAERRVSSGMWRWRQGTGLERFELARVGAGWALRGVILAASEGRATEVRYELFCDESWRTQRAGVLLRDAGGERALSIEARDGRWYEGEREKDDLRGCLDIDLGWSPSTNTLPIRRLDLAVGQKSGLVTAAWVRFPELALEPLPQEYERLSDRSYRYTSRGGAFTAVLEVDAEGLVVDYEGGWQRLADR
jgi:uncharacterized protein